MDICNGITVKGVNFRDMIDAGDPVTLAQRYVEEGADELVFLDITATSERRKTLLSLVTRIAEVINIPFTVGGGVRSVEDAQALIHAGADKISVNSAAIENPQLITDIAAILGSQCVVLAIDTQKIAGTWQVFRHGGKTRTHLEAISWAQYAVAAGAGEILLTSIDSDGMRDGFSIEITSSLAEAVSVPVIASGGAGKYQHFTEVFGKTKATGALAASVFHFGSVSIPELKQFLYTQNIPIRL